MGGASRNSHASKSGSGNWANRSARKPQIAINGTIIGTTAPTLINATVGGVTLALTYDKPLDTGSTPANTAFTVTVAGTARTVSNVVVSGSTVTLTLSGNAVTPGQVVTVSYTVPSANPIQGTTGNDASALSSQAVTVLLKVTNASVAANGVSVTLTFNGALEDTSSHCLC